jgi:hypothetical protein
VSDAQCGLGHDSHTTDSHLPKYWQSSCPKSNQTHHRTHTPDATEVRVLRCQMAASCRNWGEHRFEVVAVAPACQGWTGNDSDENAWDESQVLQLYVVEEQQRARQRKRAQAQTVWWLSLLWCLCGWKTTGQQLRSDA